MQHDNELICVAPKLSKSATPEVKVVKDRTNIGYDRFFIHFGYLTKELEIRKVNYSIICKSLFGDTDPHQITTYWPEKTRDNTCGRFWATFYVRCMGVSIDGGEMIPVDSLNYVTVRLRNCL